MDYEEFLSIIEHHAGLDREAAERAARATLQTLAERLSRGEAHEVGARLPDELVPWLFTASDAERMSLEEFLQRVAERAGIDPTAAERQAGGVFEALRRAIGPDELADVLAELPHDFQPLIGTVDVASVEEFRRDVATRAGLDDDAAQRATDAVLETLAERIAPGEVDDLESRLPPPLHRPLELGKAHGDGSARRMPRDEFVRRVAAREATTPDQARRHVRAVLGVLREAVSDEAFADVMAQLPPEYTDVLPSPPDRR